ncbi:MAG: peroxiredoxin Q/BCP [Lentimonas sp.]|jgi:peroxiredoxin Q/BCP
MKHLKIGDASPSWEGKNEKGDILKKDDFLGHKLAIYFYPKDNTPGCTTQSCNIRDNYSTLQEKEITILGVSADSIKSHQKFIAGKELPFSLIADEEKKMLNLFGVWGEKKFMGRTYDGIHRTTFLMDENGVIVNIIEKPKTKFHAEEIIELFEK